VRAALAGILLFLGMIAIAAGVLYLVDAAHSLPTFFPGYKALATGKLPKHGIACIAGGAVLAVAGIVVLVTGSRRRRSLPR
jgi:hypothetical protein